MSLPRHSSDLREVSDSRSAAEIERVLGPRTSSARWLRWVVLLALLGAGTFGAFHVMRRRAQASLPRYQTAQAARGDLSVTVTASGSLASLSTVEVGAEISGRVSAIYAGHNDRVRKGQLLAELDPEQLQASVDESSARVSAAEAAIEQAEATLTEAEALLPRVEAQAKEGLATQRELEAARANRARAQAALAAARADTRLARATTKSMRSKLGKARIVSPIDGIVLSRLIEPGQTVTAGFQTPVLFRIAEDLRSLALHVFIDEADIGRVRDGSSAFFGVDAYPNRQFPSQVLSIRNEAKAEQNVVTYEAVLAVNNAELLLRPGMTANATIVAEERRGVLLVPNAALRFSPPEPPQLFGSPQLRAAEGSRVFQLRDGVPQPISVKVGASDGLKTEILEGVKEGTPLVVDMAVP